MKLPVLAVALFLLLPGLAVTQTAVGTAYFSNAINWSQTPDLYFSVTGAPPSVCGDLVTTRNGSLLVAPGWICTDANGNATRGPWTWAGTPADQTDTNVHFNWPNGTATYFTTDHVWDKTCPSVQAVPFYGGYPGGVGGIASDNQWGAGFDDGWTRFIAIFFNDTTSRYWNPGTGYYDSLSAEATNGRTTPLPSHGINWFFDPDRGEAPRAAAHVSGNHYTWTVFMTDGDTRCSVILPQGFTD